MCLSAFKSAYKRACRCNCADGNQCENSAYNCAYI